MAEIASKQSTRSGAGTTGYNKRLSTDLGKTHTIVITSPDTVTWADGDLLASGVRLPTGTRFLIDTAISCDAMGSSVVAAIGIRDWDTKVAISASGIASAISVAAAGRPVANNGALVAAGVEYVTTVPTELYMTISGAVATANKQIRAEVSVLFP